MVGRKQKIASRRRARRVKAADNDLLPEQWDWIKITWGQACAYCRTRDENLQKDCVLPISRGGRYTLQNVVPACQSCNASKCNSEVTSWMRRKRLDEKGFLEAWVRVNALWNVHLHDQDTAPELS